MNVVAEKIKPNLQCQHPRWASVHSPAALPPVQLPANVSGKATVDGQAVGTLHPCWIPSWNYRVLVLAWPCPSNCGPLESNEQMENCCLPLFNFAFQIN